MPEIKNLKEAATKIKEEIERGGKIIIVADSDLDGVCSAIILKDAIYNLSGKVPLLIFPDREFEGYGLTFSTLSKIEKETPALLILLDFGITSFDEVAMAKQMGFSVLIIDHHEVIDKLPQADIIVDPKQPQDETEFKEFATAGLVLNLAKEILGEKMTNSQKENYFELAALATLADMMPREGENQKIIEEGLKTIENSWRPAFNVYFKKPKGKKLMEKISHLISLLNVREMKNGLPPSFRFLSLISQKEVEEFLDELEIKNKERKGKIKELVEKVKENLLDKEPIIFEGGEEFEFSLISAVAAQLCQKFKKPTFIYKKINSLSWGAARAPAGYDLVKMMKSASEYLISFGGHPQAAGFRILNENLEKFREILIKLCT